MNRKQAAQVCITSARRVSQYAFCAVVLCGMMSCGEDAARQVIDGQDVSVVFIHSSDIHSRLLPYNMDVGEQDQALGLLQENAPFGGIARLAAVVRQERSNHPRMAYLDTGDVFQGAPIFNAFNGEVEFKAMNMIAVDAMAIGNHEFDNGPTAFVEKALTWANFPLLAANYLLEDPKSLGGAATAQTAQPYTVLNLQGLRVGVIGLGNLSSMASVYKGGNSLGITPLHTRELLQSYVDFLRPEVDLVVVIGHIGYHDDLDYIPRTEGIDMVFGGHLHIALNPPNVVQDCDVARLIREKDRYDCNTPDKLRQSAQDCFDARQCPSLAADKQADCQKRCDQQAKDECAQKEKSARFVERRRELEEDIAFLQKRKCHPRDVLLVHSGAFLKYIGKLAVTLRQCNRLEQKEVCAATDELGRCTQKVRRRCVGAEGGKHDWEVATYDYQLIPVDKNLPEDPKLLRLLDPYLLELNRKQRMTEVIGFTANRVKRFSAGSGDSQLGNLVADSMQLRNQVWADFSVTNSLGIRSDMVTGPVDREQMTNVFPFENTIAVMYLSGTEVQELMDYITQRSTNRGCQSQAQVGGLTAVLKCGGCNSDDNKANRCARSPYNGEACASRVTIGGSGKACLTDNDCNPSKTNEICTGQDHPDPAQAGKKRCWLPIECSRSYRLATNDYIAKGGSGFKVLERNTTQRNLGISLRQAAIDFMSSMPTCAEKTPYPRRADKPRSFVVSANEEKTLLALEAAAQQGRYKEANAGYLALRQRLVLSASKATDATEKKAFNNYLACSDDCAKGTKDGCNGVAYQEVKQCTEYNVPDRAQCEAIGRLRGALRCIKLPCIVATEDGRQQREYKTGGGGASQEPYEPWPE